MAILRNRPVRRLSTLGIAFAGYRFWRRRANHPSEAVQSHTPQSVEEIVPSELTSPGTISDPKLEERRAEEAVARERESRASPITKFDELRLEQESERHERAATVAELELPGESS
jgi:hypothetical protein